VKIQGLLQHILLKHMMEKRESSEPIGGIGIRLLNLLSPIKHIIICNVCRNSNERNKNMTRSCIQCQLQRKNITALTKKKRHMTIDIELILKMWIVISQFTQQTGREREEESTIGNKRNIPWLKIKAENNQEEEEVVSKYIVGSFQGRKVT